MGRPYKEIIAILEGPTIPKTHLEDVFDDKNLDFEDDDFLEHGFLFMDDGLPSEEDSDVSDSDEGKELDEDELDGQPNRPGGSLGKP